MAKLDPESILGRAEHVLAAIGEEWITRDQLATKTGVGKCAIQRTLAYLVNRKFIEIGLTPPTYGGIGNLTGTGLSLAKRAYRYRLRMVRRSETV